MIYSGNYFCEYWTNRGDPPRQLEDWECDWVLSHDDNTGDPIGAVDRRVWRELRRSYGRLRDYLTRRTEEDGPTVTTEPADPGCWFHGVEPVRPEHVRVCGECGHAFTATELVRRDLIVRLESDRDVINEDVNRALVVLRTTADATDLLDVARRSLDLALEDVTRPHQVDDVGICPLCGHDF